MEFLGGFMKGLKPLMDASGVEADESMQLVMLQGEVSELEGKRKEAYAKIGQTAYNMDKANTFNKGELAALYPAVEAIEAQLNTKKQELEKAQKAADDKKKAEEEKLAARTCPECGEVNVEGTRFCSSCGSKLGVVKPTARVCKACGAQNGPEAGFCGECGARLEATAPAEIKCPGCGAVAAPGVRFCNQCGSKI